MIISEHFYEVIDLIDPNTEFKFLAKHIPKLRGSSGGILLNETPVICGGKDVRNKKYMNYVHMIGQSKSIKFKMILERTMASSIGGAFINHVDMDGRGLSKPNANNHVDKCGGRVVDEMST